MGQILNKTGLALAGLLLTSSFASACNICACPTDGTPLAFGAAESSRVGDDFIVTEQQNNPRNPYDHFRYIRNGIHPETVTIEAYKPGVPDAAVVVEVKPGKTSDFKDVVIQKGEIADIKRLFASIKDRTGCHENQHAFMEHLAAREFLSLHQASICPNRLPRHATPVLKY